MFSFGITNTENFDGLFLQVSKISLLVLINLLLLFQQFAVGDEGLVVTTYAVNDTGKLLFQEPDTLPVTGKDSIKADTLSVDTNIANDNTLQFPVKYHAKDSIRVNIIDEIVYLYGSATVDYDDMHLKADYIVIDMNNKEMFAQGVTDSTGTIKGNPEFSQAEQKFRSTNIRYNFNTKKGKIAYVITQEGEGYIHGEVVKKDPENNFFIKNGQYTTCDLDTPHFAITSNKLKVIKNNKIVTGPAYLTIEGVPTPLLIPFGFFPNKKGRSSGLIFPAFGESAQRGFYFQHLGYYLGFNDYYNLALTSDIYTKGSYTLDAASSYKKRYKYKGNFTFSYAKTVQSEEGLPDFETIKDYKIVWSHSQDPAFNPNSSFNASVNAGSNTYYKNTISSVKNFLSNELQSSVSYSRTFPEKPYNFTTSLNHRQNTITKQIELTTPDASFNVSRINPFKRKNGIGKQRWYEKIGTSYSMRMTNRIETYDSLLFRKESLQEFKNGAQHIIPVSTAFNLFNYFNFSPSFNYTERWYLRTTRYKYNPISKKIIKHEEDGFRAARDYQTSLGISTRIYGMYQYKKGPIKALRHVISPSVSFAYRPDFGKSVYGYYRNVQIDSTGKTRKYSIFEGTAFGGPQSGPYGNIGFSLDNNLEMKVKTNSDTGEAVKKIKLFESIRISSGYNVIADSMKLSNFSVNGRTSLFDKVTLNFGGTLNPYAFDENNKDYNKFLVKENGRLVRLTNADATISFSLSPKNKIENKKFSREDIDYINAHPEEYVNFDIPYNVAVSYSFRYTKNGNAASEKKQSTSVSGDLSLTPKWKIGFNSWYDITDGRFTNLGVNIYRDLHCWEMRMGWIPFGFQESWNFQINVKSTILQDLKLLKKKEFYDR